MRRLMAAALALVVLSVGSVAMAAKPGGDVSASWCWTVRVAGELLTVCSK